MRSGSQAGVEVRNVDFPDPLPPVSAPMPRAPELSPIDDSVPPFVAHLIQRERVGRQRATRLWVDGFADQGHRSDSSYRPQDGWLDVNVGRSRLARVQPLKDDLSSRLQGLVESDTSANPAFTVLIDDYARYHAVLTVVGGAFLVLMIVLTVVFWKRFRRSSRSSSGSWTFERKTYLCFGLVSAAVALLLALIVAANISTALKPVPGFVGSLGMISDSPGPQTAALYDAYDEWLASGSPEAPPAVSSAVDERLSWQRPKAIISTAVLLILAALSAAIWRYLIRKSRSRTGGWPARDIAAMVAGVATVAGCLLLMLMVMGNTQAAVAPISMTLFYG